MDLSHSPRAAELLSRLERFMHDLVLPSLADWQRWADAGAYPLDVVEPLQRQARALGLWNLCLPRLADDEPGTRLSNLDYAPLAEAMGRVPWAAELFNCNAPDSGNMELLQRFASPAQRQRWLRPLLDGTIRSCFAMSEPDAASSDPTGIGTRIERGSDGYVVNGRKWFITGAAHPHCRLAIVVGRSGGDDAPAHRRHTLLLVPMDAPGLTVERNIPLFDHVSVEGHCEIVLRDVRVPLDARLGDDGEGFALAQVRLAPGRLHHAMRTIGQCELALELMCERVLERRAFGHALGDFANVQDWIAASRVEIDQARLLALRAAWRMDRIDDAARRGADDQPALRARDDDSVLRAGNEESAVRARSDESALRARNDESALRADVAAIKLVAGQLQTRVLDRAIQSFGAMGLSRDTPLARLWAWGRALRIMDGPDEVHARTLARAELRKAKQRRGANALFLQRWRPPG